MLVIHMIEAIILISSIAGKEKFIVDELKRTNHVIEAYGIMGEYDVLAIIEGDSIQELDNFISDKIRKIPYVSVTSTLLACRSEQ